MTLLIHCLLLPLAVAGDLLHFNWTLRMTDAPVHLSSDVFNPVWMFTNDNTVAEVNSTMVESPKTFMPTVEVRFVGEGISFNGFSDGWTHTQRADGVMGGEMSIPNDPSWFPERQNLTAPASENVLFEHTFDYISEHWTTLGARSGNWKFQSVTIMTAMASNATSIDTIPKTIEPFINATTSSSLSTNYNFTGQWELVPSSNGLPARAVCREDAFFTIPVPENTAYIVINGTRGPESSPMNIRLVPSTVPRPEDDELVYAHISVTTEAVLFMEPLDPMLHYMLTGFCTWNPVARAGHKDDAHPWSNSFTSVTFYEGSGPRSRAGRPSLSGSPSTSRPISMFLVFCMTTVALGIGLLC